MGLTVREKQIIIAIENLLARNGKTTMEGLESFGSTYFCSYKQDWKDAFHSLLQKEILQYENNQFMIHPDYEYYSKELIKKYPRFRYWYNDWYCRAENSKAHSMLCNYSYGIDLSQTGMMTYKQIEYLTKYLIKENKSCLDMGCGSGHISEYIADTCSCRVTGVDIIANGIRIARQRTQSKVENLRFLQTDILNLSGIEQKYDYIFSFDTIYFVGDQLCHFIENSLSMLHSGGKLLVFYSAWNPKNSQLLYDSTRLGECLNNLGTTYHHVDFTDDERKHWLLKHEALLQLKSLFTQENNEIVYQNRLIEAEQFAKLARENKLSRYLYVIDK